MTIAMKQLITFIYEKISNFSSYEYRGVSLLSEAREA